MIYTMLFPAVIIVVVVVFMAAYSPIEFLSPEEFGAVASRQRYFLQMTAADLHARAAPNAPAYLAWYRTNVLDWSWYERIWMRAVAAEAERAMRRRGYAHMVPDKRWRFAKVAAVVERGFPHTHEDVIVWSEATLRDPFWEQVQLAVHEAVHVWQRQHPDETRRDHIAHGFQPADLTPEQRAHFAALRRNNPDTDLTVWQHDGSLFTSCYRTNRPTSISDVDGEDDHPNEIAAYRIADEVMN
jgi:hypothetical protein